MISKFGAESFPPHPLSPTINLSPSFYRFHLQPSPPSYLFSLVRMITKSLVLRISRENKRTPVILDDQFAFTLENLVSTVATEVAVNHVHGTLPYLRLNRSASLP